MVVSAPDRSSARGAESFVLPRLALIAVRFTDPGVAERVIRAAEGGVSWIHLRDHDAADDDFEQAAGDLIHAVRRVRPDILVSINARLSIALRLGTGLHVGIHGPSLHRIGRDLPGSNRPVGYSAHTVAEGEEAIRSGAQYLFMSPVFPTDSKPGHPGVGLETLRSFTAAFPETLVFALGGIEPQHVPSCIAVGAYGVAVVSGILAQTDPAAAARAYDAALRRAGV